MITSTLVIPVIAVSTLAAIIFIGLGFLPKPSRATAMWSAGFAIAMVGSYAWLASDILGSDQLRALGSALVLAPMPLMWSGLRAYRGLTREFVPLSSVLAVVIPLLLLGSTYIGEYGIAFRVLFASSAIIAALIIIELVRLGPQLRDESFPLIAVSAAFILFAAITIINGILVASGTITNSDSLQFLRTLNLIGVVVYIVCMLVTTLLLTTHTGHSSGSPRDTFEMTARTRLNRAEAAGDGWWSLLDIRLDDPEDIRAASSTAEFNAVGDRFGRDVDEALPSDADIKRMGATRFIVLIPRAQGGVREVLTDLLGRVSAIDEQQGIPLRLSASVGWAPILAVGYDFDTLIESAAAAALTAHTNGGDRWERIHDEKPSD